jgi:restriction endonuclease
VRFRYTVQPYQTAAVDAVVDCFAGQPHRSDATANAPLRLSDVDLLANVHRVQDANALPRSAALVPSAAGRLNLDVEMETGTGKTYVYIKTIFELHRRYGWGKFIVVVPGVAIREGVLRSFELTADHFAAAYGRRVRVFAYRSRELHRLETFSADPGINVMVINAQAFNATAETRRIHEELDDFQSRRPIDVLAGCRPVLVLDEPQRLEGRRTGAALAAFRPLAVLRYSATHRTEHNLVHRLDAVDAYRQGLVKRIAVRGVTTDGQGGPELRRLQIREAVNAHLDRERELAGRGIKTLSLFFIDEVRHYRDYTRDDRRGLYLRMFEEEYRAAVGDAAADVASVHSGYFSVDRRTGRLVDPLIRRSTGTTDDLDAYDLILRDRERLLSPDEPVRFVFSHSALREGWDNPNVFVLCMLKQTDSTVSRRQEVGRGLRLAVDGTGERVHDPDVNRLTVVAGESYADFVAALQREAVRLPGHTPARGLPPIVDGRRPTPPPSTPTTPADRPTERVDIDSAALVARCVRALDDGLADRTRLRYTVRAGVQQAEAFALVSTTSGTWTAQTAPDVRHDLLGELAAATTLTRRTIAAILGGVRPAVFALYARDPERFLTEAAGLISVEVVRVAVAELALISSIVVET